MRNIDLMDFACGAAGPEVKPREMQKEESKLQIRSGLRLAEKTPLKHKLL